MKLKLLMFPILMTGMLFLGACEEEENKSPECELLTPSEGDKFFGGDSVKLSASAEDPDGSIKKVMFYVNSDLLLEDTDRPFECQWDISDSAYMGLYTIKAYAYDNEGSVDKAEVIVYVDSEGGFNPDLDYGQVTDIDGNIYRTIEIGEQVWMAENLKATKYADGTAIPLITDSLQWAALDVDSDAYCWYENDESMVNTYGALYSWPAASQGLCPDGWHLPTDEEWKSMEIHLGMSAEDAELREWRGTAGNQLKEKGYAHWEYPNVANNASGFTALPAGFRAAKSGVFYPLYGAFWTASVDSDSSQAWFRALLSEEQGVYRDRFFKNNAYSVRCVQD